MDKRIAIAAVLVVAVLVVGGLLVAFWPKTEQTSGVIYWTQIAPVNQKAALAAGTVDAAVGWEPYSSAALYGGANDVVVWSDQVWPHHPCCVIAVNYNSPTFVDNTTNHQLVARVLKADMVANDWIVQTVQQGSGANYTALLNMGAAFAFGNTNTTSVAIVQSALSHIEYGYQITSGVKQGMANFTSMFADLGQISGLAGYSNVTTFINGLTNTSYLSMASDISPSSTILGTVRLGYLNGDLHQFARVVAMNASLWGGKNLFAVYGVQITSPAPYANGGAVMDAFAAKNIDMGYLGCPPAILKRINSNTPIQIVALVNSEGSAIVAHAGITSLSQLVGKTVATPGPASIQHLLLLYYCTQNGYTLKLKGT